MPAELTSAHLRRIMIIICFSLILTHEKFARKFHQLNSDDADDDADADQDDHGDQDDVQQITKVRAFHLTCQVDFLSLNATTGGLSFSSMKSFSSTWLAANVALLRWLR